MYKNVLQSMTDVAIWPVISFIIFFVFFIALLAYVFLVDKKFIQYMKSLPMDDEAPKSSTETVNRHV